ncbi:T9SS type A sorting domain-containing protein [Flavobacterium sp.]|uniref:T9SS type A sorting domain-containing protein n=1 Tax=Flavobacterium sp. TaxID=239 RepID=UPI00261E6179|nr:T9SS type A sorting domain-containing protein [Flavobacterium sp.]
MKFKYLFTALFFVFNSIQEINAQNWNTNFGVNGYSKIEINNRNTRGNILLQLDDGSLIVGVNSDYSQWGALFDRNIYIYKLNPNGLIDASFGTNGFFFIPSGSFENFSWVSALTYSNYDHFIYGLAKVAGVKTIFRFDTNGILDTNFGNNGWLNEATNGIYNILLIQNDGKILLVGMSYNNNITKQSLERYNTNGNLDTTFGNNGLVINDLTNYAYEIVSSAKIYDNKIILVGSSYNNNETQSLATISRYNLDGSLDTSFGLNGYNITFIGPDHLACFKDIDINSNGDIIAAGFNLHSGGTGGGHGNKAILVKYNANGILDNSFNGNGIKIFDSINGANDYFNTVSYLKDGKIIAGGSSGSFFPIMQSYYYLTKVNSDGTLHSNFYNSGYMVTDFENGVTNVAQDVITTSKDEIFSIGITRDITDTYFIAVVCKMDNSFLSTNKFYENETVLECLPNPVNDYLNVYSKLNIKDIQLFSIDGRLLEQKTINNFEEKTMLNFEHLSKGNYLLKFTDSNGRVIRKKIIKQ